MASLIATTIDKVQTMTAIPVNHDSDVQPSELSWEALGAIVGLLVPVLTVCVLFGSIQANLSFVKESIVEFKNREKEKEEKHSKTVNDLKNEIHSTEKSLLEKLEEYQEETEINQKEKREEFKEYLLMHLKELILPLHREIDQLKILHQRRDETLNDLKRKVKDLE
jgi:biopolymer transport protein ExbB/TolQ